MIAVQLFNGKFFFCNDISKSTADECQVCIILIIKISFIFLIPQGQYFEFGEGDRPPQVVEREWSKQQFHYDNVAAAMLTLFAVQTTEGWPA